MVLAASLALLLVGLAFVRTTRAADRALAASRAVPEARWQPPLSVIVPLRGADARTEECLRSWSEQRYAGSVQVLLCLQDADDSALPIARRVADRCGARVRVREVTEGWSGKMSNLRHGLEAAEHDLLVFADGDIRAGPGTCARIAGALGSGADLVACLPRVGEASGIPARAVAELWRYVILGFIAPGIARDGRGAIGGTLAMRRETLERLGGLEPFRDYVAEDVAIGRRAAELGLRTALGPPVGAPIGRISAAELWRRFSRGALLGATMGPVRENLRFAAVFAWIPILVAAAALSSGPLLAAGAAILALRIDLAARLARAGGEGRRIPWEAPLGDLLFGVTYLVARLTRRTTWGGIRYRVGRDGRMARADSASTPRSGAPEASHRR